MAPWGREAMGLANAHGASGRRGPSRRDFCRPRTGDPRESNALSFGSFRGTHMHFTVERYEMLKRPGGHPVPDSPLPWTGDYENGLGNKISVAADANPEDRNDEKKRADGYGLAPFDFAKNLITFECWPRPWPSGLRGRATPRRASARGIWATNRISRSIRASTGMWAAATADNCRVIFRRPEVRRSPPGPAASF